MPVELVPHTPSACLAPPADAAVHSPGAAAPDADRPSAAEASPQKLAVLVVTAWHNLAMAQLHSAVPKERAAAGASYLTALALADQTLGARHPTTVAIRAASAGLADVLRGCAPYTTARRPTDAVGVEEEEDAEALL